MNTNLDNLIQTLINKPRLTRDILSTLKRQYSAKHKTSIHTNSILLQSYHKLLTADKLKKNENLEKLLKKREIRTLSGVAPIAVLTKPYPCPGQCIYCPSEKNMPKSYLSNEPAVMRAILNKFAPYKQVQMRLQALENNGHETDKCELIIMGGTWSCLPKSYQTNFIKKCFQAFNEFNGRETRYHRWSGAGKKQETKISDSCNSRKDSWKFVFKKNEKAKHRVVGLTLETRPDYITPKEIKRMRSLGCTRVELGVQSIYDDVLKLNQRNCTRQQIINATHLLKNAGFKITYHLMPNLPGSTPKRDLKMFREIFTNPSFQPDQLKIYPCVLTKHAKIYKQYLKNQKITDSRKTSTPRRMTEPRCLPSAGIVPSPLTGAVELNCKPLYKPYTQTQLVNLLIAIKKIIPPYVRITRLIRDIPSESIIAGNKISNLRQLIQQKMTTTAQKTSLSATLSARLGATRGRQNNPKPKNQIRDPWLSVTNPRQSVSLCQCIRCREIRNADYKIKDVKLIKREYFASGGKEIFLSYEDVKQNKLIAFLRLRLPQKHNETQKHPSASLEPGKTTQKNSNASSHSFESKLECLLPILRNSAILREVHTYGTQTPINQKGRVQHRGFGKKLIKEAEKITHQAGYKKLAVISGIGVRDYYRKLGYKLQDEYMVKNLTKTKNRPKIKS